MYSFLKQVRFENELRSEDSIQDGLAKIVDKPRDCFIVDQLLFMEKQAELLQSMTQSELVQFEV